MSWFTSTDTYSETVWSEAAPELNPDGSEKTPGKGDTAIVVMRPLNAGDQADIQDILRMEFSGDDGSDESRSQLALGSMRRMSVQKALVDWTIPGPKPTPESIRQLSPSVFEQIYSFVKLGNEHPTSPPSEEEASANGASQSDEPAEESSSSKSRRTPS